MIIEDKKFAYDSNKSYQANFFDWYLLSTQEREYFNEEVLTSKEAMRIFNSLYKGFSTIHTRTFKTLVQLSDEKHSYKGRVFIISLFSRWLGRGQ